MRRSWRRVSHAPLLALAGFFLACAHRREFGPPPESVEQATSTRSALLARAPKTFRYVHQVVARYGPASFVMTGFVLGMRRGDFLVSGLAPMGPKLFDVAKVQGQWHAHVYVAELAKKLDPTNIGRAVERMYFLEADGPLTWKDGAWVSREEVRNEAELDSVETIRAPGTLDVLEQRFYQRGKRRVTVHYEDIQPTDGQNEGGERIAHHLRFEDARGFTLELEVTDYKPGVTVTPADLTVSE